MSNPKGWTRRQAVRGTVVCFGAFAAPNILRGAEDGFVLSGGRSTPVVDASPNAEVVVVRAGRIAFVGARSDVGSGTRGLRAIDLKGSAAYPGFVDAHCHPTDIGLLTMLLDLTGTPSIADLRDKLGAYARQHPKGAIVGSGWIETHWPERRFPNLADIDGVVPDRPVLLWRIDGHAALVNSAALALAGITKETPDPAGGRIERDASGAATGMLVDNATALVNDKLPPPSDAENAQAVANAVNLYAARGWTGIASMDTPIAQVTALTAMAAEGSLPIRADAYLHLADAAPVLAKGPYTDKSGLVRVRGVKLFMDGALGSRGALLLAPYSDTGGSGLAVMSADVVRDACAKARAAGAQVATHAIGDRGNRLALDAYQAAWAGASAGALKAARWRIEHAQILSMQDLPRFGQLGIIASMQPSHCISDMYFAPSRLGPSRLKGEYAWKSLLNSGAIVAAGSDAPVEKGEPLVEFYAAIYRHALNGFAGPDWHLEEAVTRAEALRMLTWAPAYAAFAEGERGTLAIGKRADISAFSADLMTVEPAKIPVASAVLTVVDGRVVHSAF